MKFDMSPVPEGAYVTSATAYIYDSWTNNYNPVRAHQVLSPWSEATVSWTNFGADANFAAAVVAQFMGGGVGYKTFDLTGLASGWVSGDVANDGILLEEDLTGAPKLHTFAGSEVSKLSMRPKLVVCYAF